EHDDQDDRGVGRGQPHGRDTAHEQDEEREQETQRQGTSSRRGAPDAGGRVMVIGSAGSVLPTLLACGRTMLVAHVTTLHRYDDAYRVHYPLTGGGLVLR